MLTEIIILAILLILSGIFSGAEIALFSLTKLRVKFLVDQKKRGAKTVERLKKDPHKLLITILIGNNLVNVGASALAVIVAQGLFQSNVVGIVTGVMTFLILVFGEITPKSFAITHADTIALIIAKPLWVLGLILYPIVFLLDIITGILNPSRNRAKKPLVTQEELRSYVKAGGEAGTIKKTEQEMIHKIFKFDEISVKEIMIPLPDMVTFNASMTVSNALKSISKYGHSRYPVYEKTKDNIIGVIIEKDLLKAHTEKKAKNKIKNYIDEAYFIPETKKIDTLLRQFQRRKQHLAIVVDEHGVITGLVTIEDVLEEIVGEIVDETDKIEPLIQKTNRNTYKILGKTDIGEVNENTGLQLKEEKDFETLSGYILHHIGRIPKKGETIELPDCTVTIEKKSKNRIEQVKLVKK